MNLEIFCERLAVKVVEVYSHGRPPTREQQYVTRRQEIENLQAKLIDWVGECAQDEACYSLASHEMSPYEKLRKIDEILKEE